MICRTLIRKDKRYQMRERFHRLNHMVQTDLIIKVSGCFRWLQLWFYWAKMRGMVWNRLFSAWCRSLQTDNPCPYWRGYSKPESGPIPSCCYVCIRRRIEVASYVVYLWCCYKFQQLFLFCNIIVTPLSISKYKKMIKPIQNRTEYICTLTTLNYIVEDCNLLIVFYELRLK